ncbi:hypothetical protein KBY23_16785 [Ruegeria pomeroyi]|nr:hypothetical protein [Ruegeria pomeroyi]
MQQFPGLPIVAQELELKSFLEIIDEFTEFFKQSEADGSQPVSAQFLNTFDTVMAKQLFEISERTIHSEFGPLPAYTMPVDQSFLLCDYAKERPDLFDYCIHICVCNITSEIPVPEGLKLFLQLVLNGSLKRPTPAHRERSKDFLEQLTIYHLVVKAVAVYGLSMTRNDVSDDTSACDAVAIALTRTGKNTTYTQVKDLCVHPKKQRLRWEIETYLRHTFGEAALTLKTVPRAKSRNQDIDK